MNHNMLVKQIVVTCEEIIEVAKHSTVKLYGVESRGDQDTQCATITPAVSYKAAVFLNQWDAPY
jgi:hypothetical protein